MSARQAPLPVWRPPGAASNTLIDADTARLKIAAEEEYRRLLYVGMTRAADRLIVCGYQGKRANPETWHAMVTASLSADEPAAALPKTFTAGDQEWTGYRVAGFLPRLAIWQTQDADHGDAPKLGRGLPHALSAALAAATAAAAAAQPLRCGPSSIDEDDGTDRRIGAVLAKAARRQHRCCAVRSCIASCRCCRRSRRKNGGRRPSVTCVRSVPRWSASRAAGADCIRFST